MTVVYNISMEWAIFNGPAHGTIVFSLSPNVIEIRRESSSTPRKQDNLDFPASIVTITIDAVYQEAMAIGRWPNYHNR
jgi:hypothetical protein